VSTHIFRNISKLADRKNVRLYFSKSHVTTSTHPNDPISVFGNIIPTSYRQTCIISTPCKIADEPSIERTGIAKGHRYTTSWHSQRRYGIAAFWRSFVNHEFVEEQRIPRLDSLVSYPEDGGSRFPHLFHTTRRHTLGGSTPHSHDRVNIEWHMTYLFSLGLYNDAVNSAD
jgi:hypothetical protein